MQQLIALGGAQARILLRDGRSRDAIELASLGLSIGKRVSAADNLDLFGIYMASAFQTVSLVDLEHAVRTTRITPESARDLAALLESTRWSADDWQRVWALEYERVFIALGELDAAGLAGWWRLVPSAYRWQPNRTASALAELYREQRRKSTQFCADAGLQRAGSAVAPPRLADLLAPNGVGRLVIDEVRARSFDRIQLKRCQFETHVSLVEVMIAAKAYADAERALPERLEDLVPDYLDALPLDRYDGAPLRYARSVPAVYSVGEDFTGSDDAAAPYPDDPRAPGLALAF